MIRVALIPIAVALTSLIPRSSAAQQTASPLEALLAEADSASPRIVEARSVADAAAARVPRAGALPDPTLGFALTNFPLVDPSFRTEMMTMTQVRLGMRVPWLGKRALREDVADLRAEAAAWEVDRVRDEVRAEVKAAYYELYFVERAREVTARNERLLDDFVRLTDARYGVGTGTQPEALKAQVERTRLSDQRVALRERRERVAARLNALLSRPTDAVVPPPVLPEHVRSVAHSGGGDGPTFFSAALNGDAGRGGAEDSVFDVGELQRRALERSPMIRAHTRRVAAEERALTLAGKQKLPDLDFQVAYSARVGLADFFNFSVSAPLPIFAGRKQDQGVVEQTAVLADHQARHRTMVDAVNAEIAGLVAELRRARDQITLLVEAVLPQARTGLSSATASYRVADVDFLTLLDAQVTLFRQELDYHRLLTDFATNLAELERVVGTEVLR